MKKLSFISLILISAVSIDKIAAQINFNHETFKEIKAKAKKENKLIFMDAYTSWCGPCKWMAKNVFTNDTVAKYYNDAFINAKIDMEAGEGIDIAKLYNVRVYPSLLFIDGDGNLIHRAAGSRPAADFIQLGKDAQNPEKQFSGLETKYKSGVRDVQFMMTYLDALQSVGLDTKEALNAYFSTQFEMGLVTRQNWTIIRAYLNDYQSKEFNYLVKNAAEFAKRYSADSVNNKIYEVYMNACMNKIYSAPSDSSKFWGLKEEIKKTGFARSEELVLNADMNYYQNKKDYLNYAKTAINYIDKYKSKDAMELNNTAYEFYSNIKDKTMLAKAEEWAKKAFELEPQPQITMDTYACVLSVNGKKQEAIKLEKQAIDLIKADPKKYDQTAIPELEKKIEEWSK